MQNDHLRQAWFDARWHASSVLVWYNPCPPHRTAWYSRPHSSSTGWSSLVASPLSAKKCHCPLICECFISRTMQTSWQILHVFILFCIVQLIKCSFSPCVCFKLFSRRLAVNFVSDIFRLQFLRKATYGIHNHKFWMRLSAPYLKYCEIWCTQGEKQWKWRNKSGKVWWLYLWLTSISNSWFVMVVKTALLAMTVSIWPPPPPV